MTNRVELTITERTPFAERYEFDTVGVYERLTGRAHFAVDPGAPAQHGITTLTRRRPGPRVLSASPAISRS